MMAGLRGWLLALVAASLICALADALMPKGAVKRVGRLVCGLVLASAILSPLAGLDVESGQSWLERHLASVEFQRAELEEEVNGQMKVIIEQEYAAYIVDKAAQLGLTCGLRVECRISEEGLCLPVRAEVSGGLTEEERIRLAQIIESDLGIPASEQIYMEEERVP